MTDYFCTAGYGLEHFTEKELIALPGVTVERVLIGKVFFSCAADPNRLLRLKTIERLFVKVLHVAVTPEVEKFLVDWLRIQIKAESVKWKESFDSWKRFTASENEDLEKFRVNSRLSGKFRKICNYQIVSSLVAGFITETFGYQVNLNQPNLEVFVHWNDDFLTIGLPVTVKPLSQRSYLKHIAVRSTVCCALCMAVDLAPNDVVLDPMCGAATILVEAVKQFNSHLVFGVDSDLSQLNIATENLQLSNTESKVFLIQGDSQKELLKPDLFDVILCDVPFGRKFGTADQIETLLESVVKSMDKVLKPNGRVAILISEKLRQYLISLCSNWMLVSEHKLRLGTLPAAIVTWRRQ